MLFEIKWHVWVFIQLILSIRDWIVPEIRTVLVLSNTLIALTFIPQLLPLRCSVCRRSDQQAVFSQTSLSTALLLYVSNEKGLSEMQNEERRDGISPSLPRGSLLAATVSPPWLQLPLKESTLLPASLWEPRPLGSDKYHLHLLSPQQLLISYMRAFVFSIGLWLLKSWQKFFCVDL